ncbi:hypothetical protein K227x_58980 [Rubripirellula lacrimiformis]|uniref:DUF433 domain-containing protein n=2 Tax=Rubripirellula lacrimiformis TaxID=1930273 RepID=A0A517NK16_9BACT|nr:hypothetical protein K227x_58980 [Rubripirellula lacrimiformis]
MTDLIDRYIEIRSNRAGDPRAFIRGTRLRVQDIVIDHQRFGHTAEQIASDYDFISVAQVHAALAYYFENREQIQKAIRDDESLSDLMSGTGHSVAVRWPFVARSHDASGDPVSP